MNRYLDGGYFESGYDTIGFGGLIIALGALALLFLLEDGRALVRMYIWDILRRNKGEMVFPRTLVTGVTSFPAKV
ncbi:hypothetical protein [Roseicyclus sp.]|uniref:hypothetical protein n=1 Tax=Roseicyclus sp. TaxID=1914329 RepID=UPI001BCDC49E|nr:hypothetical protein [Roseicyclus sp.]